MGERVGLLLNKIMYFTISNKLAAERVMKLLVKSKNDCIILPFIDHPGPMSKEILKHDFRSLTVCEQHDDRRNLFRSYVKKHYPHRTVSIYSHDLFDLSFKAHDRDAQNICSDIISESWRQANDENAQVKFLVPLLRSKFEIAFFRNLYYQMTLKLGLCSHIRVQYHFLVSDRQYRYLIAKPSENLRNYRASSVLYNTIFKINRLDSFDLETCFGISVRKLQNTSESKSESYKMVHLLWLEPRADVIEQLGPRSLLEFRFLVSQMMQRRTVEVVRFLDNWFGSCASDIRSLGISEDTRSGDLTAEQFLRLHLYLRGREEYVNSTFLQAAASYEDNLNMAIDQDSLAGPMAS